MIYIGQETLPDMASGRPRRTNAGAKMATLMDSIENDEEENDKEFADQSPTDDHDEEEENDKEFANQSPTEVSYRIRNFKKGCKTKINQFNIISFFKFTDGNRCKTRTKVQ